jgi:hypothetical protein
VIDFADGFHLFDDVSCNRIMEIFPFFLRIPIQEVDDIHIYIYNAYFLPQIKDQTSATTFCSVRSTIWYPLAFF